jgi:hypothetical protein
VLFVAVTATIAALIAHIGIDVLGDYLLPHDSFDDLAHGSRSFIGYAALAIVASAGLKVFFEAIDIRNGMRDLRRLRTGLQSWSLPVYLAAVVCAAFVLLAAMEFVDLASARQPLDDLGDLFGGSLWLGAGITFSVAAAVACGMWWLARWAYLAREVAGRIAGALLLLARSRASGEITFQARRLVGSCARVPALARSASKRGPPISFS